ncbi:uncharacterized protein LOC134851615 [Symsagittifera roscoffensis]|uniref:uncharacterized protein LOC134851615 n=1 Tax=Symsagittifera roscoffensis TaxID=84072 RepID=UPI00307BFA4E
MIRLTLWIVIFCTMGKSEIEDQYSPFQTPATTEDEFVVLDDEELNTAGLTMSLDQEVEEEWLVPVEEQLCGVLESSIPPEYRSFSQWVTLDDPSVSAIATTATRATSSVELTSPLTSSPPLVICACEHVSSPLELHDANNPCPNLKSTCEKLQARSNEEGASSSVVGK